MNVIDRPLLEQEAPARSRLRIIDCDIHPSLHSRADLNPFLAKRWQEHLKVYGDHLRTPYIGTTPYPRSAPLIARRDAWPPTGGPPGSDLDFMQKQHLDPLEVEFGILQVLDLFIFSQQNLDFGAAIQRAINEWQLAHWSDRDPRLKASILAGQDDTEAAIAEIERCAKIGRYVQVNVSPRANEPLGRHRYWPIYARAEVPHLKRRPSEYVREHFWFTTQPIDEPDQANHLRSLIEWVGVDRLLFSSDYPHWDFDDPRFAFRTPLGEAERLKIFNGNARARYKL